MARLALKQLVHHAGVTYYVADALELRPEGAPPLRWLVLRPERGASELFVEERDGTLRLLRPIEGPPSEAGAAAAKTLVRSETGRRASLEGVWPLQRGSDHSWLRLGDRCFEAHVALLGGDGALTVPGAPERPGARRLRPGTENVLDWALAAALPVLGLVSFASRAFGFVLPFLALTSLSILWARLLAPEGFRRTFLVLGAAHAVTMSLYPVLFLAGASSLDFSLVAFGSLVIALCLVESQPFLLGRLADGAWWVFKAGFLAGAFAFLWALVFEELEWEELAPVFGVCSFALPVALWLSLSVTGRDWLRRAWVAIFQPRA